ncbi:unnamed protein product [Phytophthora lilii]|uniref:Unnamed protein product n=1 Tax=Phytophthora lilii TaxID=2077276 RepID=A0A9W6TZN3_9STRA|nr:unnamed protein product [Phytophthora lilii]
MVELCCMLLGTSVMFRVRIAANLRGWDLQEVIKKLRNKRFGNIGDIEMFAAKGVNQDKWTSVPGPVVNKLAELEVVKSLSTVPGLNAERLWPATVLEDVFTSIGIRELHVILNVSSNEAQSATSNVLSNETQPARLECIRNLQKLVS